MGFKMKGFSAFTKEFKYIRNKNGDVQRVEEVPSFGEEGYVETEADKFLTDEEMKEYEPDWSE